MPFLYERVVFRCLNEKALKSIVVVEAILSGWKILIIKPAHDFLIHVV